MRFVVYYWSRIDGYLLQRLLAPFHPQMIPASREDNESTILERVSSETDLFIFHLDTTNDHDILCTRARRCLITELRRRGTTVVNGELDDISKRAILNLNRSLALPDAVAERDGDPSEQLIVKTNLNSGGLPEHYFQGRTRNRRISSPSAYPVLARRDLPDDWWRDTDLHIERYILNRDHRFFRVSLVNHLVVVSEGRSTSLIKRIDGSCPQMDYATSVNYLLGREATHSGEPWIQAGRSAVTFTKSFLLDYGAVDIVMDDESRFFVIDVNKTPYWGADIENLITSHLRLGFCLDA